MKRTVFLPLAALALALGGVIGLPRTTAAETKRETGMTRNDFDSECRGAGGTPTHDTNNDGMRVWNCGFGADSDKWGTCVTNEEGYGDCYKKGYGGGKPVDRAVSDDPSRPTPGIHVPGFGRPRPTLPTRPPFTRPEVIRMN